VVMDKGRGVHWAFHHDRATVGQVTRS
jgi:hypothetical protein